jgi:hypothetical protein
MFRNKDLCPGPGVCPEVLTEDPHATADALPCEGCPLMLLNEYLESPGGRLISVVIDLDFSIQTGIPVRLDEITYPEFLVLRQLNEERQRFEVEEMKRARSQSRN